MILLPLALLAGVWINLPLVLQARQEVAVAAADGKIFLIGGLAGTSTLSSVEEFDPATGLWRNVASLPQGLHHAAAATIGRSIYVIGGYRSAAFDATDSVYRYDLDANRWTAVARLPAPRAALAAATIGNLVYAVGGVPGGNALTVYDPATDRWSTLPSMPTRREHLGATAAGGRLYVASGRFTGGNTNAFEVFDPVTNGWAALPPIPTARSGIAVTAVGNRVYVFGGEGNPNTPTGVFSENESFDVVSGTWQREESMPVPRHGIGAATIGNTIYIPAGAEVQGFGTSSVHDAFITEPGPRRRAVRK
jgi:N-acetylneuraminic acid mutarotase